MRIPMALPGCVIAFAAVILSCDILLAEGSWGNLAITFRYDGKPPQPQAIVIDKDPQQREKPLYDETLVVHPQSRGIDNVVVYLRDPLPRERINWNDQPAQGSTVQIAIEQLQLRPHVSMVRTDQFLEFVNRDVAGHNPKVDAVRNASFSRLIVSSQLERERFPLAENLPVKVGCNIHPWEGAWVVIRDNPYCGISDEHGKLVLKNLPQGEWTLQLWHERSGYVQKGRLDGKDAAWEKGRLKVHIAAGENDLGIAELPPEIFGKN